MKEVAIVTDGVGNLTNEMIEKYNITVLPYRITFEDAVYRCSGVDRNEITRDEFYKKLAACNKENLPNTSIPTPNELMTGFNEALTKGKSVIAIFLSGEMSNINDYARIFVTDNFPDKDITIFDSKQITTGVGILALFASKMAYENKSKDQILKSLESSYKKIRTVFVFQNLNYLYLSGHIGRAKKLLATTFGLNPLLYMNEGVIQGAGVLQKKKIVPQLKKFGKKILENAEFNEVFFWHTRNSSMAQGILEAIENENTGSITINFFEANPLVGIHTGPNSLAFSYIGTWDKEWIFK
ncbi:MAG: DegV family protein [Candidatus Heimdallarchaeota archaeon]